MARKTLRKELKKASIQQQKRIQMLLLIKKEGHQTKASLAHALGFTEPSTQSWRTTYRTAGLAALLVEKRGGKKKPKIHAKAATALEKRLSDPTQGFASFIEAQQWLKKQFNINMEYHAVNKYIKRKFGAKLKVGRKSHVKKDPIAKAVFKELS